MTRTWIVIFFQIIIFAILFLSIASKRLIYVNWFEPNIRWLVDMLEFTSLIVVILTIFNICWLLNRLLGKGCLSILVNMIMTEIA